MIVKPRVRHLALYIAVALTFWSRCIYLTTNTIQCSALDTVIRFDPLIDLEIVDDRILENVHVWPSTRFSYVPSIQTMPPPIIDTSISYLTPEPLFLEYGHTRFFRTASADRFQSLCHLPSPSNRFQCRLRDASSKESGRRTNSGFSVNGYDPC